MSIGVIETIYRENEIDTKSKNSSKGKINFCRRFYIQYKLATRKKLILSEKERNIVTCIRKLCADKKTRVSLTNMGYSLINKENHIDCLINGKYVIITNSVITSDKQYRDEVIKKVNALCANRVDLELNDSVNNMLGRENLLMRNMISNINKK